MVIKYTKWAENIPAFSVPRPSQNIPDMVWFANIPSGNLDIDPCTDFRNDPFNTNTGILDCSALYGSTKNFSIVLRELTGYFS
jgi:hypothetical protein